MTYTGEVKNGIIVLKGAPLLEDGTPVRIEVKEVTKNGLRRGSPEAVRHAVDQVSSQIAAIAKVNDLILLTADTHFSYISNLQTENWLA